jgi:hypothetical protein
MAQTRRPDDQQQLQETTISPRLDARHVPRQRRTRATVPARPRMRDSSKRRGAPCYSPISRPAAATRTASESVRSGPRIVAVALVWVMAQQTIAFCRSTRTPLSSCSSASGRRAPPDWPARPAATRQDDQPHARGARSVRRCPLLSRSSGRGWTSHGPDEPDCGSAADPGLGNPGKLGRLRVTYPRPDENRRVRVRRGRRSVAGERQRPLARL